MKKILLGIVLSTTTLFSLDLDTTEIERGFRGFEFETNLHKETINNTKDILLPLQEKFALIKANNYFINKTLIDDNTDREQIFKLGYTHSKLNESNVNGFNLMYSPFLGDLEEEERLGINLNYSSLDSNYDNLNLKGDFYQLNFFYNKKDYNDMQETFITAYLGMSDEASDKDIISYKTKFIGVYGKNTQEFDTSSENFIPKVYIEADLKRLEVKADNEKTNNDSINLGAGIEAEQIIYDDNLKVSITPVAGYNHEFLEKRKYNYENFKDEFRDEVKAGAEIKAEYKEVTKVFARYEIKKSVNTSNHNSVVSVGFKLMI